MYGGAFDDRNDVRLSVKQWLRQHDHAAYTPEPIRRLVSESIMSDRDPVDSLADSWREASYGAMIGIIEFASEEVEKLASAERTNRSLQSASENTDAALSCLPYDPDRMHLHLERASVELSEARESRDPAFVDSSDRATRALKAMSLIKAMRPN